VVLKAASSLLLAAEIFFAQAGAQALAHAHLEASQPAANSTITAPTELHLIFSEELNLKFTGVKLVGPAALAVKLGEPKLMDGALRLLVPISGAMPAGAYTVYWSVLSADGHKTQGSFKFKVHP
jgi:methionine-rich copper-binding protein CopC